MNREGILRVLAKINARNILSQGQNVQISCPLAPWRRGHKSARDGKPSMGILINENGESLVNCFACKWKGTLEHLVSEMHRLGDEDLRELLLQVIEMETADPEYIAATIADYDQVVDAYEEVVVPEEKIAGMMGKTHKYITDVRGIDIETLKVWESGFDFEQRRAVFPVRRHDRALVGMVGRSCVSHQKPRYLNYFNFDKGRYLYGEHLIKAGTVLVVVEGLLDAVITWQALRLANRLADYSVISFLGSDVTRHQLQRILKFANEVVLFLDNDPAGWSGQMEVAKGLQQQLMLRAVRYPMPVGGDPASLFKEGVGLAALLDTSDLIVV